MNGTISLGIAQSNLECVSVKHVIRAISKNHRGKGSKADQSDTTDHIQRGNVMIAIESGIAARISVSCAPVILVLIV